MNCIIVDDDQMSRTTLEHLCSKISGINIVGICESAMEALELLRREHVDLLFLDVEMPDLSGMDLLKSQEIQPQVVIVSSKENYALEAIEFDVTDYLKKPVELPRLLKAVERARKKVSTLASADEQDVFIKVDSRLIRLRNNHILFIETMGDYVVFHTTEGKYTIHSTLKNIEESLDARIFFKVHRSFIVNLRKIVDIEDNSLVIGEKVIPISRNQLPLLLKKINLI